MVNVGRVAIVGAGVIGAGWVARILANGIDVAVFDPAPDAKSTLQAVLENADLAYARFVPDRRAAGKISWTTSAREAVAGSDWIIEAVPERIDIKRQVYAEIETRANPDIIIASSTSGIPPSELQTGMNHPERLIVGHPFNPVYLLPLVEVVAGNMTSPDAVAAATEFYRAIGMHPLVVRKEIEAFIADRLLEAVWRESLWLVKDGICTTEELDDAIRFGFGLRWAQMGLFETYRIAGGEAGMRHFLAQFGPCLKWPWTKLTHVPELNDELVERVAGQSDKQSGHRSIRELERIRDENLVAIMNALSQANGGAGWGAGVNFSDHKRKLSRSETGAQN